MSLFERLYSPKPGSLQDNFIAFWVKVASRFAANPFVVGYDPLNEPFPSNIYTDPELFYAPGSFDRKILQPLYKRVFEQAYLPASTSKIMFYEPA
jgi:endoglycosylceramidase